MWQQLYLQFKRHLFIKIAATLIPIDLVANIYIYIYIYIYVNQKYGLPDILSGAKAKKQIKPTLKNFLLIPEKKTHIFWDECRPRLK